MNTRNITSTKTKIIGSWALVIMVAGLIFFMSAKNGNQLDNDMGLISLIKAWLAAAAEKLIGHQIDVSPVGHFTEYFIFGLTLANALRFHLKQPVSSVVAVVIASLYGVSDEIHQIFVPTRSCDPMDWLVDTIAAACAVAVFAIIMRKKNNHPDETSGIAIHQ